MRSDETAAVRPGRIATMRDVAEHLGVSRQLVSLVLRGAAGPSEESRARILAAADELGYRPNASARLLRQQRTRLLGLAFALRHPFQVRVAERLFVRAAEAGFGLVLGPITSERSTDFAIAELLEQRVEAVIVFNPDHESPQLATAAGLLPVALLGERTDLAVVDNVHVDDVGGLRLVVEHLAALGHRDITYLGGQEGRAGSDRADAYVAAMTAAGLADHVDVEPSRFDEESGAEAARRLLEREALPTALVCGGDRAAIGALTVLRGAGVRVPDDVSIVGFDDSYIAALSFNALTTVRQDVEATVEATLAAVFDRLEHGTPDARRVVATPTELVVRQTTGPVPAGR
jgi:DNA-binding LacI/PurR family transcriptional regulator